MKKLSLRLIVMGLVLCACEKVQVQQIAAVTEKPAFRDYLIKKGNNFCEEAGFTVLYTNVIKARVIFDSSAIYTSVLPENQADINKLIGFSDCATEHQQNSARLGWSWNGQKLMIYAYTYVNYERVSKVLGPVELNTPFACSVRAENECFYFTVGSYSDSIRRYCPDFSGQRYKLNPYFGGDEVAPHDVHIAIAEE